MMKVTSAATVIAPGCDRRPPTPSTTSRPQQLQRDPRDRHDERRHPWPIRSTLVVGLLGQPRDPAASSRPLAPAARTVRIDPTDAPRPTWRSSPDLLLLVSRRRADPSAEQRHAPSTHDHQDDETRRAGSMSAHRHEGADEDEGLFSTASARPWVRTAYSSVVSVPTRETRSPNVRRAFDSLIGRCRMRPIWLAPRRETTAVPVRCSRKCLKARDDGCRDHEREHPTQHAQRFAACTRLMSRPTAAAVRGSRSRRRCSGSRRSQHATMFEEDHRQEFAPGSRADPLEAHDDVASAVVGLCLIRGTLPIDARERREPPPPPYSARAAR